MSTDDTTAYTLGIPIAVSFIGAIFFIANMLGIMPYWMVIVVVAMCFLTRYARRYAKLLQKHIVDKDAHKY